MNASTTQEVLGEIRAWMGRRGMSQSDIARAMGVAPSWMSKRLAGDVELSLDDMFSIADALDVSPIVFFDPPSVSHTELRPTRYSSSQDDTSRSGAKTRTRVAA